MSSRKQETSTAETTKTIQSPSKEKNDSGSKVKISSEKGLYSYDFDECITFLNKKGKELFGEHFAIHPGDYEIIFKLLVFSVKDTDGAARFNINLNKGILLSGPVGCGKTSLMTLINFFYPQQYCHVMRSCREISFEFIRDGYEVIHKYSNKSFNKVKDDNVPRTYCFDDLGIENNLKYFGNECNVMAEILLSRYELFIHKKMLTHITTNLSASEIEELYGNRVRSRMREMFNLVSFDGGAKDKRV